MSCTCISRSASLDPACRGLKGRPYLVLD
jgi:hypothetical protein